MFHCLNFSNFWDVDYKRKTPKRRPHFHKKIKGRVRQIFWPKLVPGHVACKKHLPGRMSWLSNTTSEKVYQLEFTEFYFRK